MAIVRPAFLAFVVMVATLHPAAGAVMQDDVSRVQAPYFVLPNGTATEQFPLKDTRAVIRVAGVIAHVHMMQTYQNTGSGPLEAQYVFPAATRAAVTGMQMTVGTRLVVATMAQRDLARQMYNQAKAAGQGASLLEQYRPNVFQMNVANIMPGDQVLVEIDYTELLVPTQGVYELVYPAVVGPRYAGADAEGGSPWVHNPYVPSAKNPTSWDVAVHINAGMAISALQSPSHRVAAQYTSDAVADVLLDGVETHGGDRDFVLRYRLGGNAVQPGMLLYPGKDESFFIVMLQPPLRTAPAQVLPHEYIFVVDVSGSMSGFPLNTSKTLMRRLVAGLRPQDRFNVLLFAGASNTMAAQSVTASKRNIRRALNLVDSQRGGGGTELLTALKTALALPTVPGMARSIVLLTDGYVEADREAMALVKGSVGTANLFPFGIGRSVNRALIEGLARAGGAEPFVVTHAGEATQAAQRFQQYVSSPVLTHAQVAFDGFEAFDVQPARVPDVFAQRPVVIMGKYDGNARGLVHLTGTAGNSSFSSTLHVAEFPPDPANAALRSLWARTRVTSLTDLEAQAPSEEGPQEITALGLKYGIMTAFTSFVAVDSLVQNPGGMQNTVRQPLPLPQGVSNGVLKILSASGQTASVFAADNADLGINNNLGGLNGGSVGNVHGAGGLATRGTGPGGGGQALGIGGYGAGAGSGKMDLGGRNRGTTKITVSNTVVEGGLSQAVIDRTLRRFLSRIRFCYEKERIKIPTLAGRAAVTWTIDAAGRVTHVEIATLNNPEAEACIAKVLAQVRFPAAPGRGLTMVDQVLVFMPSQP